uniref:SWIM-type domain-containing protein n=1 Tax=Ananas comosus var. bracteatus TaxID=296719 RepID=A0A6V7Q6H6_ANACO|nr:unnamed protein product [Ananas comosus var. bracteatus]
MGEPLDGNVSGGVEENNEDAEDGSKSDSEHEWSNFGQGGPTTSGPAHDEANEKGTKTAGDNDQSSDYQPSEDLDSMSSSDEDVKLEEIKEKARHCEPLWAGETIYEVHFNGRQYTVSLAAASCECRQWDVTRVPCKHAVSAIYKAKLDPEKFVHKYFLKETYIRTYSQMIMPIPDSSRWPKVGIEPIMLPL